LKGEWEGMALCVIWAHKLHFNSTLFGGEFALDFLNNEAANRFVIEAQK
jgi:hypothetical protein